MNIYLLEQTQRTGYDTYDAAVVFAASAEEARLMHPSYHTHYIWNGTVWRNEREGSDWGSWADPDQVTVTYLGDGPSNEARVVCGSFNAG